MRATLSDEDLEAAAEHADPTKGRWSASEMLLASLLDEIRRFEHMYVASHVKKGQAGKAPEPMPRPGVRKGAKTRRSRLTDDQRRALDPRLRVVPDASDAS